ncbi:MAG: UDP-3-O-(3-hydroxymyristoyl)glucosamine N-acyltransferase [Flavobacteriales bacterium]|nr:UDP-3-O-(3-hydroxymyristoyl)glucosamine N-acyltransferase [Flavobacteriales bacterium]MCB9167496.1 UDP-3-O-(3-hydroxymyristoyl)glucosamine N-acyltransferase [Flavobacteriales bacterium]
MQFSAGQIAQLLHGEVDGDAQVLVSDVAKIEEGRPGTLTFLANPKYTEHLYGTQASVVLVEAGFTPSRGIPKSLTLIRVADPRAAFARLLEMHAAHQYEKKGIEQPSYVSPKATIGKGVYIGAFCHVGDHAVLADGVKLFPNCTIGDNVHVGRGTRIHSGVHVYHGCRIGADCLIHSGVVIGSDGFGFQPDAEGRYIKVAQIGNVVIEDAVEIGANCTIDRATMGSTVIRTGVKLDNLVQVAHNVEIGAHTVVVSQTGIAGSTRIGSHGQIGGQVGIVGHLTIGDRVRIAAQSGIGADLPDDAVVQGSPAFGIGDYKRSYVVFRDLPGLRQRIHALEQELERLKGRADTLNEHPLE